MRFVGLSLDWNWLTTPTIGGHVNQVTNDSLNGGQYQWRHKAIHAVYGVSIEEEQPLASGNYTFICTPNT